MVDKNDKENIKKNTKLNKDVIKRKMKVTIKEEEIIIKFEIPINIY